MSEAILKMSPVIWNDFDQTCDMFELGPAARNRLAGIIGGHVHGNRDRPLHGLCIGLDRLGRRPGILQHLMPQTIGTRRNFNEHAMECIGRLIGSDAFLSRDRRALICFIMSMDQMSFMEEICRSLWSLVLAAAGQGSATDQDAEERTSEEVQDNDMRRRRIADTTAFLARKLHAYRMKHLTWFGARASFIEIRRWAVRRKENRSIHDLGDGDALAFWSAMARPDRNERNDDNDGEPGKRPRRIQLRDTIRHFGDFVRIERGRTAAARTLHADAIDDHDYHLRSGDDDLQIAEDEMDTIARQEASLTRIDESPLRILLKKEIDDLRTVVRMGSLAREWPRTTIAALRFVPVQNVLIEARRTGTASTASRVAELTGDIEPPVTTAALPSVTRQTLLGMTGAMTRFRKAVTAGKLPAPNQAILRRRSFAALEEDRIQEELGKILEPMLDIAHAMGRLDPQWRTSAERDADLHAGDRDLLTRTLIWLYAPDAPDESTRPEFKPEGQGEKGRVPSHQTRTSSTTCDVQEAEMKEISKHENDAQGTAQ